MSQLVYGLIELNSNSFISSLYDNLYHHDNSKDLLKKKELSQSRIYTVDKYKRCLESLKRKKAKIPDNIKLFFLGEECKYQEGNLMTGINYSYKDGIIIINIIENRHILTNKMKIINTIVCTKTIRKIELEYYKEILQKYQDVHRLCKELDIKEPIEVTKVIKSEINNYKEIINSNEDIKYYYIDTELIPNFTKCIKIYI